MTILNKKSAAVKYDGKRHYKPNDLQLNGRSWFVDKDRSTEKIFKVVTECQVLACPFQDGNAYVSRIKGDHDHAEWALS